MARIFISYKRQDKDKVFPIVEEIKQKTGVDCWIDLEGIESGDQFQNVIIEAIDNADIVVFMLSKNFIAPYKDEKTGKIDLKKQTFPEKEVMYALNEGKRLIPLSIDGTTVNDCKWLKFNCSGLDCIEWHVIDQRNKILKNIHSWDKEGKNELPDNSSSISLVTEIKQEPLEEAFSKSVPKVEKTKQQKRHVSKKPPKTAPVKSITSPRDEKFKFSEHFGFLLVVFEVALDFIKENKFIKYLLSFVFAISSAVIFGWSSLCLKTSLHMFFDNYYFYSISFVSVFS